MSYLKNCYRCTLYSIIGTGSVALPSSPSPSSPLSRQPFPHSLTPHLPPRLSWLPGTEHPLPFFPSPSPALSRQLFPSLKSLSHFHGRSA